MIRFSFMRDVRKFEKTINGKCSVLQGGAVLEVTPWCVGDMRLVADEKDIRKVQ